MRHLIIILILGLTPQVWAFETAEDDSVFEQQNYNFNDYSSENSLAPVNTYGFDGAAKSNAPTATTQPATVRETDTVPPVEVWEQQVAPASVANVAEIIDESVEEVSAKEISARTQAGYAAASKSMSPDDGKLSVNLRKATTKE